MKAQHSCDGPADRLIGEAPGMQQLRRQIPAVASCDANLLLQGESGVGKELVARTVHAQSSRRAGPFVGINCAAIHETLLESELFGHEAGAFTGASQSTPGFLRAAVGGTVLLDEIGDMSLALQSKLLRALEERAVIPVGGTELIAIDIRVIAASHCDLARAVREGKFRRDLYYRLNVVRLSVPPLRERRGDIRSLAEYFSRKVARMLDLPRRPISPEAMRALTEHDWPGNVRELGNAVQHAYVLGSGQTIRPADLPEELLQAAGGTDATLRSSSLRSTSTGEFPTLREVVRGHIELALETAGGVRTRAAGLLGINRTSLWRMLQREGIAG